MREKIAQKTRTFQILNLLKAEVDKLTVIDDDRIYSSVVHGFDKKVKATDLTDEIELKRHEGARQVAIDQLQHTKKQLLEQAESDIEL